MTKLTIYQTYALVTLAFWGLWQFIFKFSQDKIDPTSSNVLFQFAAFVIAATYWLFYARTGQVNVTRDGVALIVLCGALASVGTLFYMNALVTGPVSQVTAIGNLAVLVPVLGGLLLGEPLTLKTFLGIALCVGGIYLLSTS